MGIVAVDKKRDGACRYNHETPKDEEVHEACRLLVSQKFLLAKGVDQNAPDPSPDLVKTVVRLRCSKKEEAAVEGVAEKAEGSENKKSE
jgi:hypothetical protein